MKKNNVLSGDFLYIIKKRQGENAGLFFLKNFYAFPALSRGGFIA